MIKICRFIRFGSEFIFELTTLRKTTFVSPCINRMTNLPNAEGLNDVLSFKLRLVVRFLHHFGIVYQKRQKLVTRKK